MGAYEDLSPLQVTALRYSAAGYTAIRAGLAIGTSTESVLRAWQIAREKLGTRTTRDAVKKLQAQGCPLTLPSLDPTRWVREWELGREFVEHLGGVPWADAPKPSEDHSCTAQTRGVVRVTGLPAMGVMRCACGAVNIGDGWDGQNTRPVEPARFAHTEWLPRR